MFAIAPPIGAKPVPGILLAEIHWRLNVHFTFEQPGRARARLRTGEPRYHRSKRSRVRFKDGEVRDVEPLAETD